MNMNTNSTYVMNVNKMLNKIILCKSSSKYLIKLYDSFKINDRYIYIKLCLI